jgi:hypothetical protein
MTAAALVDAARESFARARARVGGRDVEASLAGRRVRLRFAGDFFAGQLLHALALDDAGAEAGEDAPADLTLHAWDAASTGERLGSASWQGRMLGPGGVVEDLSDERYKVSLELHGALASVLDTTTGEAFHYVPDPGLLPAWEATHPARMLLAGWARSRGLLTCHAAAVADEDGRGLLLCGGSGAGKSTTTLAALADGMRSAGDDYVLVTPGRPPKAHALYTSTLLELGHYRRNAHLMPHVDLVADQVDRQKAVMFTGGTGRPGLVAGFGLIGLVALRVERGSSPAFLRSSAGAVLRALAPSTLSQLGMVDAVGLARLAQLCRGLPCFELRLGDDPAPVPGLLRKLVAEAAAG